MASWTWYSAARRGFWGWKKSTTVWPMGWGVSKMGVWLCLSDVNGSHGVCRVCRSPRGRIYYEKQSGDTFCVS